MILKTTRFGELTVSESEIIFFPQGLVGFPGCHRFCLVDPNDETLILWLQSLEEPALVFPVLEPKIFKPDYAVKLSAAEYRDLKLENFKNTAVFSILTIGSDISQMTANLKAPIVINLSTQTAKQVILQENEHNIKHPMFKELRTHILTAAAQTIHADRDIKKDGAYALGAERYVALAMNQISTSSPVMSLAPLPSN